MNLLNILAEKNLINKDEISSIAQEARDLGDSIESVAIKHGASPRDILEAKSEYFKIPAWHLEDKKISSEMFKYVPEESVTHYRFAPIGIKDGVLEVGIIDPDNIEASDALNFISSKAGMPFKLYLISEDDFKKILQMYKGFSGEVNKALSDLDTELSSEIGKVEKEKETDEDNEKSIEMKTIKEDAPITKIVANILRYAVEGGASDVHIEHMKDSVRVRFRVDGVLRTSLVLPTKVHRAIIARVKVLSLMRLDEKRKPQDGRFSATIGGNKIDFRVSTFPTHYGEKVVMRILDTKKGIKTLDDTGLSEANIKMIRDAIKSSYGMILVSGPTGSGKSTTLYSMLMEMDREKKNILSLEDPIEYKIDGVSQSQVKPEIGYTFANGLRTTLRQDPDVIMVGEIRDKETAQLAVQAALTGHLVLSTIHTNNALGVIPRLIEMDIDPYLIAPTLIIAIAQRLVRTLCPNSGKEIPIEGSMKAMLDKQFSDLPDKFKKEIQMGKSFFEIEQTSECPNGTRGRIAVFEIVQMDKDIEKVILKNPSEAEIWKVARQKGMLTMKEDAIIKAFNRIVPFEEINTIGGKFLSSK